MYLQIKKTSDGKYLETAPVNGKICTFRLSFFSHWVTEPENFRIEFYDRTLLVYSCNFTDKQGFENFMKQLLE